MEILIDMRAGVHTGRAGYDVTTVKLPVIINQARVYHKAMHEITGSEKRDTPNACQDLP